MKRQLLLFIFSLISAGVFAQEAVKYPLLEHFTNTKCPICGARNPDFHDLRKDYDNRIHHISFHPSSPYPSCELHQHNPSGNQSRFDYYRPPGTPTVFLDGEQQSGPALVTPAAIEDALDEQSFFELDVTQGIQNDEMEVQLELHTRGDLPAGQSYRLYVAAVERELDYNAPNGEDRHYNVFRAFITDKDGLAFTPPANGTSSEWEWSIDVDGEWAEDQIYALAFIQNETTGEIENSGSIYSTTTSAPEASTTEWKLYPNPASHSTLLKGKGKAEWQLHSITGRVLRSGIRTSNQSEISLRGLPAGPYILRLQTEDGSRKSMRLIVLR